MVNSLGSAFRTALAGGAISVVLSVPLLPAAAAENEEETVQALRYGVTLYHYYQQDYFNALTELMAAQELQALATHTDNAELLRGGISLSYGMDYVAENIFETLLTGTLDAPDRNQAWFYLGKMTWQRGQLDRAEAALSQMSKHYQGVFLDEANYLRASISLSRGDQLHATTMMHTIPEDSPWRYYLAYNLGAAEAAGDNWLGAVDYFQTLDVLRGGNDESKSLRDKAMNASGYAFMAAGQYEQALQAFTGTRLHGNQSDRALLGYGWAALELGDFERALPPWQMLNERSLMSASARESLIALPYAYEQMGHYAAALQGYEYAAESYATELELIDAATDAFTHGDLPTLLGLASEEELDQWMFDGAILPTGDHVPYLEHLMTQHHFQLAMRELEDLYHIDAQLRRASHRLAVLTHVDHHQKANWDQIVLDNRQQVLAEQQQALRDRFQALQSRFAAAEDGTDSLAFVTPTQRALWTRVQRAEALADSVNATTEQRELLALMRGLLIWQDNEDYPAQVWKVRRQLEELESLVALSAERVASVNLAVQTRNQKEFANRIAELEQRVFEKADQLERVIARAEIQLRQLAVAELQAQGRALVAGMGQSRLAVARLYDLASVEVSR